MVLAEAALPEVFAPLPGEEHRGGVEEDERLLGEQGSPPGEELLFEQILDAAGVGLARRLPGQRGSEPGHGAVEVVQGNFGDALDPVLPLPAMGSEVGAGVVVEEAVEDGEEDGALDVEGEAAPGEGGAEDVLATAASPEAVENGGGSEGAGPDVGVGGAAGFLGEGDGLLGEAAGGSDEAVESAGSEEVFDPAEAGDDGLSRLAVAAVAFDDLEVGVFPAGFFSNEHGVLSALPILASFSYSSQR